MNNCLLVIIFIVILALVDFIVTKVFGGSKRDVSIAMIVLSVIAIIYAIIGIIKQTKKNLSEYNEGKKPINTPPSENALKAKESEINTDNNYDNLNNIHLLHNCLSLHQKHLLATNVQVLLHSSQNTFHQMLILFYNFSS